MNPLDWIDGYKSYIAAVGLFGLAVYQVSQGQFDQAMQSFMAALAVFGVRHAIAKSMK